MDKTTQLIGIEQRLRGIADELAEIAASGAADPVPHIDAIDAADEDSAATALARGEVPIDPAEPPVVVPPEQPPQDARGDEFVTSTGYRWPARARYLDGQEHLLQGTHAENELIEGHKVEFTGEVNGTYVCISAGWAWDQPGGDWLDKNGERYGDIPWAEFVADYFDGDAKASSWYDVDVTALVQHCYDANRWQAFLLRTAATGRDFAQFGAVDPYLTVEYEDGEMEVLRRVCAASLKTSTALPTSNDPVVKLSRFDNAVLEFQRPSKPVLWATLSIHVTNHRSGGSDRVIRLYVADPPRHDNVVEQGPASDMQLTDDLGALPGVISHDLYVDGTQDDDVFLKGQPGVRQEKNWRPDLWSFPERPEDVGRTDIYPDRATDIWVGGGDLQIVGSDYKGENFEPLAPGVGALRIHMSRDADAYDLKLPMDSQGTSSRIERFFSTERILAMAEKTGPGVPIYVSYWVRLGSDENHQWPFGRKICQHQNKRQGGFSIADNGGKFGITPGHPARDGGGSGSGGCGKGWSMREAWKDQRCEVGGPTEGGMIMGIHDYDMNCPKEEWVNARPPRLNGWGQRGGRGGCLYPDNWYHITSMLRVNTSDLENGTLLDGEMIRWLDGYRVFYRGPDEDTGFTVRHNPPKEYVYDPGTIRPMGNLVPKHLVWIFMHGGKTRSCMDRTLFIAGVTVSTEYLGMPQLPQSTFQSVVGA